MRANGAIPKTDPFSHSVAGQPWIEQGWLPDLLTASVFAGLKYAGLGLLLAGIVTATLALSYVQSQAHRFVRAFAVILAAITSAVYWSMRPQIFSFLFFAAVLWILAQHRRGQRAPYGSCPRSCCCGPTATPPGSAAILPSPAIWWERAWRGFLSDQRSALSGQPVSGQPSAVSGRTRRCRLERQRALARWRPLGELLAATALSLPMIAVNPNGVMMLAYPFKTVGIGVLQQFIQEWATPDFHQLYAQPFIWLLLLTLAALALAGRRARFTDLILLAGFCYMALMAGRNIALFALVAAPILATYGEEALRNLWGGLAERYAHLRQALADRERPNSAGPRLLLAAANWLIVLLLVFAGVVKSIQPLSTAFNEKIQREQFPAGRSTTSATTPCQGRCSTAIIGGAI